MPDVLLSFNIVLRFLQHGNEDYAWEGSRSSMKQEVFTTVSCSKLYLHSILYFLYFKKKTRTLSEWLGPIYVCGSRVCARTRRGRRRLARVEYTCDNTMWGDKGAWREVEGGLEGGHTHTHV